MPRSTSLCGTSTMVCSLSGPEHVGFGSDYVYDMPAFQAYAAAEAGKFPEGSGYHGPRLT